MLVHGRDALNLTRIVAGHFADNPISGRVLATAGFRPPGSTGIGSCLASGEVLPFVEWVWDA